MKKTVLSGLFICFLLSIPVFSARADAIQIEDLQKTMDGFTQELAYSLPFNSGLGLNWADAHIKNFPHFGVGFSLGFTTMEATSFDKLISYFSPSLPSWVTGFGGFPLPGYALEGRLGGLILPFDIGFKFGVMPIDPKGGNFQRLDYLLVGGDIRYRLVEDKGLLPGISIGVGINYLKGGLGMNAGNGTSIGYTDNITDPDNPTDKSINLAAPLLNLDWETKTLEFKAQISKKFLIITPYLGIGASNGWSKAGYSVKTKITDETGQEVDLNVVKPIMEQFGLKGFDANGFGSSAGFTGWSYRLYGGFSFNLPFFKIELTGLYNLRDQKYGGTIGARFQI
ncbi:MAG: hypothetical protein FWF29_03620 [Treponema sp.]|nr:hypothetical protein [Treponema sp.]